MDDPSLNRMASYKSAVLSPPPYITSPYLSLFQLRSVIYDRTRILSEGMKLFQFVICLMAANAAAGSEDPGECGSFHKGFSCALNPGNIISASSGLEDEVSCQSTCGADDACNFFTFMKFNTTRDSVCVHHISCEEADTTRCQDEPDCSFSLSGPSSPSVLDACCGKFEHKECDAETPFMTVAGVADQWMCQDICRNEMACSFYTLFINVCFLYTNCSTTSACGLCSSGPAFPAFENCPQETTTPGPPGGTSVLLIGGLTSIENPTDSVELITSELSCEADLPPVPVKT